MLRLTANLATSLLASTAKSFLNKPIKLIDKKFYLPFLVLAFTLLFCPTSAFAGEIEYKPLPPAKDASIELMAGQMIILGFRGDNAEANPILNQIQKLQLGGIILFDRDMNPLIGTRNVTSKPQLKKLVASLHKHSEYPLFVGVDQEGGKVARLKEKKGFLPLPSAREMGKSSPQKTLLLAEKLGEELADLGINIDFAPVVDVEINPENPAIAKLDRAFSNDPQVVTAHAKAFLQGLAKYHVLGSIKHFPGHASSLTDTHNGISDITSTWQKDVELLPYKELISQNKVDMVMVGHLVNKNLDQNYPASLSKATISGLLREDLGFKGVVITDDLQMGAITDHYSLEQVVRLALDAGVDIFLYGNNLSYDDNIGKKVKATILKLVASGEVSRQRLEESYTRIRDLKAKLN